MNKSKGIKKQLKQEDLQPIIDHIEKYYDGNVLILKEWLDRAMYMLHFIIDDDEFTALQKRNMCGVLLGIKESLMEAYFKNQDWNYEQF